jgi:hypothetical protein
MSLAHPVLLVVLLAFLSLLGLQSISWDRTIDFTLHIPRSPNMFQFRLVIPVGTIKFLWPFLHAYKPLSIPLNRGIISCGGARSSIVVKALWYKPKGRGFEIWWGEWCLSIYLILSAEDTEIYSSPNRNKYQKGKQLFLGSKTTTGAWDWQPYRHLWAECLDKVGFLTSHNPLGFYSLLRG